MKNEIAEMLLRKALSWSELEGNEIIQRLKFLSEVKYNEYRNYDPGMRFIESLSCWLNQFENSDERKIALKFVLKRLVFISETQMEHLVSLAYHQIVFPILITQTSGQENFHEFKIKKIVRSKAFKEISRKTLFIGMSDGARIGAFRRKNYLNNEQVIGNYEISEEKCNRLVEELREWHKSNQCGGNTTFKNIFLIDDFTASGTSILRKENGQYNGKLKRFLEDAIGFKNGKKRIGVHCETEGANIYLFTYIGTSKAIRILRERLKEYKNSNNHLNAKKIIILDPVLKLPESLKVDQEEKFYGLLNKYYDPKAIDKTLFTGGDDLRLGYAECALPVVLRHNCPNNSVFLLWLQDQMGNDKSGVRALFPRISRHRDDS